MYVYLDTAGHEADSVRDTVRDKEIERLEDHIASLERQLEESNVRDRENRRTIIALASRIPGLESPASRSEDPQEEEPSTEAESPDTTTARQRSWWRRLFGS